MISDSFELFMSLKKLGYIKNTKDEFWWPNSGTFEVIVGTILTQQTKWQKVEKSLLNLKEAGLLDLESLTKIDTKELSLLIKPSGFYNTKAKRLKLLNQSIRDKFGDFENFQVEVSRRWLLEKKGVGEETADSILNYACYREAMVVDSYTAALLKSFGFEFEDYRGLQAWIIEGLKDYDIKVRELFPNIPKAQIYALFHGMIVEYCKEHKKGKKGMKN